MIDERIDLPGVSDVSPFDQIALDKLLVWLTEQEGSSGAIIKSADAPSVRINGVWRRVGNVRLLTEHIGELLQQIHQQSSVAQLQAGSGLNFRYQINVRRGVRLGFRVNAAAGATSRADIGIKMTFRPIPEVPPDFDALQFEDVIRNHAMPRHGGIVIVSGPTGSGKTTALASIIARRLQTEAINFQSAEAPIEFDYENLPNKRGIDWQQEVGVHTESFDAATAEFLRMEPDVLLVGEARDRATIEGAIGMARTGHTVYTTTHTNDVADTIDRMASAFSEDSRWSHACALIHATRLIIHQRLEARPDGGRVALREILALDDSIRDRLYEAGETGYVAETRRVVHEQGQPLIVDARRKYAEGRLAEDAYRLLEAQLSGGAGHGG